MQTQITAISLLYSLSVPLVSSAEEIQPVVDPDTGLITWTLQQDALKLELVQRLPDQTRAFFQGRGFLPQVANELGEACVFQTIARNILTPDKPVAVEIHLADWRVQKGEVLLPVKLKEDWLQTWKTEEASRAARIAFRWATFPTRQTFLPGDYNWGMISFDLPPGTNFDLRIIWRQDADTQSAWIRRIQCPNDS